MTPSVVPQDESTPRVPVTPYGVAKSFAHEMAGVYRAARHVREHGDPLQPRVAAAPGRPSWRARSRARSPRIATGQSEQLVLGNIDVHRDWGYAPDYVDAMLHIGRAEQPGDFVVATGEAHSVRDFVDAAFRHVGIDDWDRYVSIDPAFYRPADPQELVGDSSRLRGLGWNPSVDFGQLVTLMVDHDLELLRQTE